MWVMADLLAQTPFVSIFLLWQHKPPTGLKHGMKLDHVQSVCFLRTQSQILGCTWTSTQGQRRLNGQMMTFTTHGPRRLVDAESMNWEGDHAFFSTCVCIRPSVHG